MSDNEESSDIFAGLKLWIAQLVPTRSHWVGLVEKHGGRIVKLDTQADIRIADHARKDAPPGSTSWRFIEESVKNGQLEDKDGYPAASQGATRPATTMSRTAFSAEDDQELWRCVMEAEQNGGSLSGNKIYKDLAAINPRHTWHSWRDRWVKTLVLRKRPALNNDSTSPPQSHTETSAPSQNVGRRRAPPSSSSGLPNSPKEPEQNDPQLSAEHMEGENRNQNEDEPFIGQSFMEQDYDLLVSMYAEIEDVDPEQETEAWNAFADKYSHHTAEEWKSFWQEVVRPTEEGKRLQCDGKAPLQTHKPTKAGKPKSHSQTGPDDNQAPGLPESISTQKTVEKAEGSQSHGKTETKLQGLNSAESQEMSKKLVVFLEALETPVHFPEKMEICGGEMLLHDVCRAINTSFDKNSKTQRAGRWQEVARLLDIEPSRSNIKALKDKFLPIVVDLWDFEDGIMDLEKGAATYTENEEDQEASYSNAPGPSLERSPDAKLQNKRKHVSTIDTTTNTTSKSSPNENSDASKRRRVDKGKEKEVEIPSTPESLYEKRPRNNQTIVHDPETQDFHFPEPIIEETQANHVPEDSPSDQIQDEAQRVARTSPELDSQSSEIYLATIRGQLDRYMALGYTEDIVRVALAATTGSDQHAATVMEDLMNGLDIPSGLQGVWTAEDDLALADEAGVDMMKKKHGSNRVEDRLIWLECKAQP